MSFLRLQPIVIFLIFLATPSFAGVVVEDMDGTITYFESGKMKTGDEDMVIIFDVNKFTLTMINDAEKSYATGTVDEFCNSMKTAKNRAMSGMSDQEKRMLDAFMGGGEKVAPPAVRIEKTGRGETIAGYKTTLYTVYRNGEKYEEIHLSDDVPIFDEVDPVKMSRLSERFSECMMSTFGLNNIASVEDDAAYSELMRKQFPMKNVEFDNGRPEITDQVVRMEKQSIPASELTPPGGYSKIDFPSLMEQSAEDSSGSESFDGFPMDEETATDESYMSSPDQPEEKPQSLEGEIGGQIKEGLKSIFGGF
ncbi:MAG: hypothetical protein SCH71_14760 [Desulfobulbaceae bacterium]|nr:hypothetical protein [Desulfobulbaceae bacterium]